MNKVSTCLLAILISLVIGACGLSEQEIEATAVQAAANLSNTQTASVPTSTPTQTITPSPTPTLTPTPTETPIPTPTEPPVEEIMSDALESLDQLKSYSFDMKMVMTVGSGGLTIEIPISMLGSVLNPDRSQGTMTMTFINEEISSEYITIGEDGYLRNPITGIWEPVEDTGAPLKLDSFTGADTSEFENLEYKGIEDLNGIPVFLISGLIPADALDEIGETLNVDYYIGVEDRIVRKVSLSGALELDIDGSQNSVEMIATILYFGFDELIEIEPPL